MQTKPTAASVVNSRARRLAKMPAQTTAPTSRITPAVRTEPKVMMDTVAATSRPITIRSVARRIF